MTEVHRTEDQQFYHVEEQGRPPDECQCANCKLWTVVYDDGEPTEIGTAYQGDAGKEAAEDICDLMNMAYDAGQESQIDNSEETKLVAFFRSAEGDKLGRDGDYDNLSPAETAIRAICNLQQQLDDKQSERSTRPSGKASDGLQVGEQECLVKGCGSPRAEGDAGLCESHLEFHTALNALNGDEYHE